MKRLTIKSATRELLAAHAIGGGLADTDTAENGDGTVTISLDEEVCGRLRELDPDADTAIRLALRGLGGRQ